MADDRETETCTRCKLNGVFIDELPLEYVDEILERFQKECICCYFHSDAGFAVFFKRYSQALEVAHCGQEIDIQGRFYKICLARTSLTVHGIATYTKDVETVLRENDFPYAVHSYEVCEKESESSGALVDYRVFVEMPELYVRDKLRPIQWRETFFEVSIFCQFCGSRGHKAFNCSAYSQSKAAAINKREPNGCATSDVPQDPVRDTSPHSSQSPNNNRSNILKSKLNLNKKNNALKKPRKQQKSSTSNTRHRMRKRNRNISLSKKIESAILNTTGVLSQRSLIIFLKEMRGRKDKKLQETAARESKGNISGLIFQLQSVIENYYMSVKKKRQGEERDVNYIKDLQKRLQNLFNLEQQGTNDFQEQLLSSRVASERSS